MPDETTALAARDVGPTFSLRPTTFEQAMQFAQMIARSDFAPKDFKGKPENCLLAVQMGAELGLAPLQSLQNIAVINGRPAVWGDGMLALVQSTPEFEDIEETDDGTTATCTVKRRGRTPTVRTFSMEDAKAAGLAGGNVWKNYPKRMRQMRARAFALRDAFADRLKGIQSAEEVMDYGDDPNNAAPVSEPKRVGSGTTSPEQSPQTASFDGAASTPAPAASTAGAASSPSLVAPQEQTTTVTVMDVVRDDERKLWRVVAENGEEFVTRDQGVADTLAGYAEQDVRLTYKVVPTRSGGEASVIIGVTSIGLVGQQGGAS